MNRFTRRNLPHWQPDDRVIFSTYRLFGSLPDDVVKKLRKERERLRMLPQIDDETPRERALREGRRMFALEEQALHQQLQSGGCSQLRLDTPRVASLIIENLQHHNGSMYALHAFAVMPNHMHILIEPLHKDGTDACWSLGVIMGKLKGYTSRKVNQLVGRRGTLWQEESFDHWVRDTAEFANIVDYIEANPVKAGLCRGPADWPWSSATGRP